MIADEDNLSDVTICVQYGLKHGVLDIAGGTSAFSVADLRSGAVRYIHDGSDSLTDNIIFKVTDGRNEVRYWAHPPILAIQFVIR